MTSSTIRFYFDYESPNAYLAWTQLPQLADRYGVAIDPLPVLYAGPLEAHGQLGPGEIAAKGRWMSKNIARKATPPRSSTEATRFHAVQPPPRASDVPATT